MSLIIIKILTLFPNFSKKSLKNRLKEEDETKIRFYIKKERQRLKHIKEDLEQDLEKKFSLRSLQHLKKSLTANGR